MQEVRLTTRTVDIRLVPTGRQGGRPVVLVPGLAAGPMPFVVHPAASLADALQRQGLQPWTAEFGFSWRARGPGVACLVSALDAALDVLCQRCGVQREEILGVGHSLGGLLLLALQTGDRPLAGLATLATATGFQAGLTGIRAHGSAVCASWVPRLRPALSGGVPSRSLARIASARPAARAAGMLTGLQFHPGATEPSHQRAVLRQGVRDLPLRLLADLAELYRPEGLRLNGEPLAVALESLTPPLLLVAAQQDRQCPPAAVRDTHRRARGSVLLEIGKECTPPPEHGWGHLDLLTGARAPQTVFLPVARFLADSTVSRRAGGRA